MSLFSLRSDCVFRARFHLHNVATPQSYRHMGCSGHGAPESRPELKQHRSASLRQGQGKLQRQLRFSFEAHCTYCPTNRSRATQHTSTVLLTSLLPCIQGTLHVCQASCLHQLFFKSPRQRSREGLDSADVMKRSSHTEPQTCKLPHRCSQLLCPHADDAFCMQITRIRILPVGLRFARITISHCLMYPPMQVQIHSSHEGPGTRIIVWQSISTRLTPHK